LFKFLLSAGRRRIRSLRCVSSHKQIVGIEELFVSARQIFISSF